MSNISGEVKYEPFHGKVLFKTPKYNDYFKKNFEVFDVLDFIALVTSHIPPKHKQYIRRYGRLCKAKEYSFSKPWKMERV